MDQKDFARKHLEAVETTYALVDQSTWVGSKAAEVATCLNILNILRTFLEGVINEQEDSKDPESAE